MKVLILHNIYQHAGGEDAMVLSESRMLRKGGHEVHVEYVQNREIIGVRKKVDVFIESKFSAARSKWAENLVAEHNADVVHVHNFWPLLTTGVHHGAAKAGAAVVQTLHNFRLICSNGLLLRDGKICEKCLTSTRAWGVLNRCYRNSLVGSLAVSRMQAYALHQNNLVKNVNKFIALTEFGKSRFVAGGLPAEKIVVKANSISLPETDSSEDRSGGLYVGRLSQEKGVNVLLEAARRCPEFKITIVGEGPLRVELEASAPSNVTFTGALPSESVGSLMRKARCLIMPSIWYEGFPVTLLEAYASGLPVVGSDVGALSELILPGKTGFLFPPGNSDELAKLMRQASKSAAVFVQMGDAAVIQYRTRYGQEENLKILEKIYDDALREVNS